MMQIDKFARYFANISTIIVRVQMLRNHLYLLKVGSFLTEKLLNKKTFKDKLIGLATALQLP